MAENHVLTAMLTPDPDGGYVAQLAELPGVISQGDTVEVALANVREAAELYLEDATPEEPRAIRPVVSVGRAITTEDVRSLDEE